MQEGTQSRKWQLTINDPTPKGWTHEHIRSALSEMSLAYWCMADEVGGESGLYHTHVYLVANSPVRFGRVKRLFPEAHIEDACGMSRENRDYILKRGKWESSDKVETSVAGTFEEWGEMPQEQEKSQRSCDNAEVLALIQQGYSAEDIVSVYPNHLWQAQKIDDLRQRFLARKYKCEYRDVKVHYVWGESGLGKTYGILGRHGPENVCRITSYRNGKAYFDAYHGEMVLVFEEFSSQFPIEEMLNYLDRYPLMLPARYSDRVACYDTVYITSNISLYEQYADVQVNHPRTWDAFLRRITDVTKFQLIQGEVVKTTSRPERVMKAYA